MSSPLWSLPLDSVPRGLSLAREANRLLVWTEANDLLWVNQKGIKQAHIRLDHAIIAAAVSEDGSAFVAVTEDRQLSWFAPDLSLRWQRTARAKATAVAVDPLGLLVAVGTRDRQIVVFHADGERFCELPCPRPARHLAFVPASTNLVATSDLGWVGAFDLVDGSRVWQDTPMADIGSLAVASNGEPICLACFSDGVRAYDHNGQPWVFSSPVPACRALATSHDVGKIFTLQIDGQIAGWPAENESAFRFRPEAAMSAMAVTAFGDVLYVATKDKSIQAIKT